MAERVRLLIWDLDETFWNGTLSEGGVRLVEAHKEIVVALAKRGIVSSICSKNDFDRVRAVLAEQGVLDYFVLPSVDWTPKGPRIRDLIETIGLRPATVMFIDDNPLNLEEALRFTPDLQTRGPEFIAQILADPLFSGKDDRELTRLNQYKLLERRRADEKAAGADVTEFLRESRIEVEIETDVEAHIDRYIELVNRTNQLNFTKLRLPENIEKARADLRRLLRGFQWQAALVRVRDRYGDHGLCGAYLHDSEARKLMHFAFSCRILGLGVERWLYQRLGRPKIEVKGEVLADLFDPAPVDWIAQAAAGGERRSSAPRIKRITARGACDIGAVVHYFHYHSDDAAGEYHLFRDGGNFRIDHAVFLFHAANGISQAQMAAAKRLGYVETDFQTRLYDPEVFDDGGHLVILGFGGTLSRPLIRHRETGLVVPFTAPLGPLGNQDFSHLSEAELPKGMSAEGRRAIEIMRAEWDYVGVTQAPDFEALLRYGLARIPPIARIFLLGQFSRPFVHRDGSRHDSAPGMERANQAMRAAAADFPNVAMIEFNDILDDSEIEDRLHFSRSGLFKVYRKICDIVWPPA